MPIAEGSGRSSGNGSKSKGGRRQEAGGMDKRKRDRVGVCGKALKIEDCRFIQPFLEPRISNLYSRL